MFKCDKCNIDFNSKIGLSNHMRFHINFDDDTINSIIDDYSNNNFTYRELIVKYKVTNTSLAKILKAENVNITDKKKKRGTCFKKHTEETKKKISKLRTEWLINNPDKHVWKRNTKFISQPCEHLKTIFEENNIKFLPEFPYNEEEFVKYSNLFTKYRNYSIDISFPEKRIGVEINGNQHYNSDKTLKPHYQEKHDYFIKNDWKIYEIYYLKVYDSDFVSNLIEIIKNDNVGEFNYDFELRTKNKTIYYCDNCHDNKVYRKGNICPDCSHLKQRKVKNRPKKEELKKLINEHGLEGVGRIYNVSGNAVKKWIK